MKKSPLASRRRQFITVALVAASLVLVVYSISRFTAMKPADGKKVEAVVATGDRPVAKNLEVYVNADGGLSLRESKDSVSKRLALIPNGTKLLVTQELEGWYKVSYESKEGWVSKEYTTTSVPAEDPTKDWQTFSGAGYKIKYQAGWSVQDYGKNDTTGMTSVVAFSNQSLPATIPAGSDFIAPVVVNLTAKTADETNKTYAAMSGVVVETITVAGKVATKYTFTSPSSNTQVTTIVLAGTSGTLIFSEAGGYIDDLLKMLNTLTIG
jgi:hypothetical protein